MSQSALFQFPAREQSDAVPPLADGDRKPLTKKEMAADHPPWCPGCGESSVLGLYYKLVEKRPTRKWRNDETVALELGKLGLTSDDLFEPRKLKSPAQMEKIPTLKNNKELLEPMIVKESSGLVLVPNEDKRQAWKAEAKDEFKAIAPPVEEIAVDVIDFLEAPAIVDPFS